MIADGNIKERDEDGVDEIFYQIGRKHEDIIMYLINIANC